MKYPKAKRDNQTVTTGRVRFSYCHVFEKYSPEGEVNPKYQAAILIPKTETDTVEAIKAAIENAKDWGRNNRWNGSVPKNLDIALRDGDDKDLDQNPEYEGCYYVSARSEKKPGVVKYDPDIKANVVIEDPDELYSGCWGRASITFYPYNFNGKKGIACALNHIQKVEEGERLGGGGVSLDSAFGDDDFGDDDDFLM